MTADQTGPRDALPDAADRPVGGADALSGLLRTAAAEVAELRAALVVNGSFRDVAADRAVRISELVQENQRLDQALAAAQADEGRQRARADRLAKDAQRSTNDADKARKRAERELARMRKSALVRVAWKLSRGLARVGKLLRRG